MSRRPPKKPAKTAAELMAELLKDPAYKEQLQRREEAQRQAERAYSRDVEPVLKALANAGYAVERIGDLRAMGRQYSSAVPILTWWLSRVSEASVKEDIVRTLSVPWAKPIAARALVDEFRTCKDPSETGLRWAIGNALSVVADDGVFEDIVQLVQDVRFGRSREMLAVALGGMRNPKAVSVLMDLLDDEDVVGHAAIALGQLRAPVARERLLELADKHPKEWVRTEARKAAGRLP